jgi:drug/metabolite transporter (DMT)-like permease
MYYEIIAFVYVILGCLNGVIKKQINIDPVHITLISTIVGFTVMSLITYYQYKKNPEDFKNKKNNLGLTDNPFKNIFSNLTAWKIGLSGTIMFFLSIYALKKLPFSMVVPISLSWIVFSLFFNKIMRGVDITSEKIISTVIVITGVLIMQYNHFNSKSQKGIEKKYFGMLIGALLISRIFKAYQVNLIKIVEEYVTYKDAILMDYGILVILNIIMYLIYLYSPVKLWKVSFPDKKDVLKLVLVNIFIVCLSIKLRYESIENLPQNRYALISSTNIIVAVVLGKLFFGESIKPNQILGAAVVIFGIMYNNLIDPNNPFQEDHSTGHFLN